MSVRRDLLLVAPAFPPHPSPATHRARFITRYAPELGWKVRVLSVRPEFYAERLDLELEELVPSGLDIRRVRAIPVSMARRFGLGDLSIRSFLFLWAELRRVCRAERPDALFLSTPPFYSLLLAVAIRAEFGVPYIVDYTDPWIYDLKAADRSPLRREYWNDKLARLLEPLVVRRAGHIIGVSEGTHAGIRRRHPQIPGTRFSTEPIGYDPRDFEALRMARRRSALWNANDGNIHVVYPGAISPTGHETVRAVLEGVRLLRDEDPAIGRKVRVHFVGTSYSPEFVAPIVLPYAAEIGIADQVDERTQRVPYIDALNAMVTADVVLVLGSTHPHYAASKVYNCIAAGQTVLAVCHEDTVSIRDAVEKTGAGVVVTYNDRVTALTRAPAIAAAMRALLARNRERRALDLDPIAEHSARSMTERVLRNIEAVVREAGAEGGRGRAPVRGRRS